MGLGVVERGSANRTGPSPVSAQAGDVELANAFKRGFAATFGLDLVTKALGIATLVILLRGLSVSSYAYITLFLAFAQFAGSAASGGVGTRYLREEAEQMSRADAESEAAFAAPLLKGTVLVLCVGTLAASVAWLTGFEASYGGPRFMLYATGFALAYSAIELVIAHYQARRRFSLAGWLSVLRAVALLGASVVIVLSSQSALAISLWLIASMAIAAAITAGPIARRSLAAGSGLRGVSWPDREETLLTCYYVAAAGFAYVDVMVAAALLDDNDVATLGASLRYLGIVLAAIPALGAVLRVRTSQADLIDSPSRQRTMVVRWIRRTTLPTVLMVVAAIVLAPVVIPLIDGGQYPGSIEVFQIFLVTAIAAYVLAPGTSMLMAQRQYVTLALIYAVGLMVNALGDVAVAPAYGVLGIAIVSSIVYVSMDIVTVVLSVRFASRTDG